MPGIARYWFAVQQQTSTVRTKIGAAFTENLVQNLMDLVFSSEKKFKWPKNGSNRISPGNHQMAWFGGYGLRRGPKLHEESCHRILCSFLEHS